MKKTFLVLFAATAVLAACSKPETPKDGPNPSTESKDPSTISDPSTGPSDSEDPTPEVVTGKVILDGKKGFNSFAEAMVVAKAGGAAATFTLSSGTLKEDILIDEPGFPITIVGKEGSVLDGTIEIHKAEVSLKSFAVVPTVPGISRPAITMADARNNNPFAIFVHDTRYGFKMNNVTVDISGLFEGDDHDNATAVVLRGETKGPKEEPDEVRGCTLVGDGQRLMQIYDAHVDLLGNSFENFYSGYAIRLGEDNGEYFENEIGPRVTIASNTFSSAASRACINFYSVFTAQITFGNGENDTNLKSDGIELMYTANTAPGSECEWRPEMLFDSATSELYPAGEAAMPEAELVWARRAADAWWTAEPLPGFFNTETSKTLDWNRSVAMDDQYIYMPRQLGGDPAVFYFPINDPTDVKVLDMTGVTTDATHNVSSCQVVDDGEGGTALLVCNLARYGQILRVYLWESVTAAPKMICSYNVDGARLGDKMTFNGTLKDGELVFVNYDDGGRFWILPVKDGVVSYANRDDYFGEKGWTGDCHKNSHIVGATRYMSTSAYILWGASLVDTTTSMWDRGEDGMSFSGQFPDYKGMYDPQFFSFRRSGYMAYASLTDESSGKYYSTIRVIRLITNDSGNESPYATMTTISPDSGLVLGIGQPTSESVVLDDNTNGNMVAGMAMRNIGGTIYLLGSDTNNALALYKLK